MRFVCALALATVVSATSEQVQTKGISLLQHRKTRRHRKGHHGLKHHGGHAHKTAHQPFVALEKKTTGHRLRHGGQHQTHHTDRGDAHKKATGHRLRHGGQHHTHHTDRGDVHHRFHDKRHRHDKHHHNHHTGKHYENQANTEEAAMLSQVKKVGKPMESPAIDFSALQDGDPSWNLRDTVPPEDLQDNAYAASDDDKNDEDIQDNYYELPPKLPVGYNPNDDRDLIAHPSMDDM